MTDDTMEDNKEVDELMPEAAIMDEPENKEVTEASEPEPEPEPKPQPQYIPRPMMLRHERQPKPAPTHRITKKCQTRYWAKKKEKAKQRKWAKMSRDYAVRHGAGSGKTTEELTQDWLESTNDHAQWARKEAASNEAHAARYRPGLRGPSPLKGEKNTEIGTGWVDKDSDSEYGEEYGEADSDEVNLPIRSKKPDASDDEGQVC